MENVPNQEVTSVSQEDVNLMPHTFLPAKTSHFRKDRKELLACLAFKEEKVEIIDNFSYSKVGPKDEIVDCPNYDEGPNAPKIEHLSGNIYVHEHYNPGSHDLSAASSLKTENTTPSANVIGKMHEISHYEWKTKNEEIVIKEEDLAENTHRFIDLYPASSLKTDNTETSNVIRKKHEVNFHEWKIKNEEIDIKEEDLTENTSRILSNCFDCGNQEIHPNKTGATNWLKCVHDNYKTLNQSLFRSHNPLPKSSEEDRMFNCNQCSYKTRYNNAFRRHLLRHKNPEEVKKFKCDHCNFKTFRKDTLKAHVLLHKNPEEVKIFKCDRCDFRTVHKSNLKIHLLQHKNPEEIKKFKCDHCNFRTFRQENLKTHLLRHKNPDEVNKIKCDHCNYRTLHKNSLKIHLLLHKNPEEVNKFICDHCSYTTLHKGCRQIVLTKRIKTYICVIINLGQLTG